MVRTSDSRGHVASVGSRGVARAFPRIRGSYAPIVLAIILIISAAFSLFVIEKKPASETPNIPQSSSVFDSRFVPPHSDFPLDEVGDSLYDFLVIRAQVDIDSEGLYEFGMLVFAGTNDAGPDIGYSNASANLYPGLQQIDLRVDGWIIRASGHDGNFTVRMYMLNLTEEIDQDVYTTSSYAATDFDLSPAFLEGPMTDYGVDMNGNSRYDSLFIEAYLNVTIPGDYRVSAFLGGQGNVGAGFAELDLQDVSGVQFVRLNFSGYAIYIYSADGPYRADIEIYENSASPRLLNSTSYTTAVYSHMEFEPNLGIIEPITERVLDEDQDGFYDYLIIEVPVNLVSSRDYDLYATLRPNPPFEIITTSENFTHMDAGIGLMEIALDGKQIAAYGSDGPYLVQLLLWPYLDVFQIDYTTQAYLASEFERSGHLVPPLTSVAVDDDSDSLFESLIVESTVSIEDEGDYLLFGTLYRDSSMTLPVNSAGNFSHLTSGTSTLNISFSGWKIRNAGYDGIYYVKVHLLLRNGASMDSINGSTSSYLAAEFDLAPSVPIPWTEDFEDEPQGFKDLSGWWASIPQAVTLGSQTSETGNMSLTISGTEPYVEVFSPVFNVSGYDEVEIRYWVRVGSDTFSDTPYWDCQLYVFAMNATDWLALDLISSPFLPGEEHVKVVKVNGNFTGKKFNETVQLRIAAVHGSGPGTDFWHIDNIYVGPPRAPTALFNSSATFGDLSTMFEFNASSSWDMETPSDQLEFRWDWDGDGSWDTGWLASSTVQHQFSLSGTYNVTLEVRDADGNSSTTMVQIIVVDAIPEFQTVLMPIVGLAMMFALIARRSKLNGRIRGD